MDFHCIVNSNENMFSEKGKSHAPHRETAWLLGKAHKERLDETAIHANGLAGNPLGFLAGQEEHGFGNVSRFA